MDITCDRCGDTLVQGAVPLPTCEKILVTCAECGSEIECSETMDSAFVDAREEAKLAEYAELDAATDRINGTDVHAGVISRDDRGHTYAVGTQCPFCLRTETHQHFVYEHNMVVVVAGAYAWSAAQVRDACSRVTNVPGTLGPPLRDMLARLADRIARGPLG